jgi:hypothetical protein
MDIKVFMEGLGLKISIPESIKNLKKKPIKMIKSKK